MPPKLDFHSLKSYDASEIVLSENPEGRIPINIFSSCDQRTDELVPRVVVLHWLYSFLPQVWGQVLEEHENRVDVRPHRGVLGTNHHALATREQCPAEFGQAGIADNCGACTEQDEGVSS